MEWVIIVMGTVLGSGDILLTVTALASVAMVSVRDLREDLPEDSSAALLARRLLHFSFIKRETGKFSKNWSAQNIPGGLLTYIQSGFLKLSNKTYPKIIPAAVGMAEYSKIANSFARGKCPPICV